MLINKLGKRIRLWTQVLFSALTNGYASGFMKGTIYNGRLKSVCVPGLNCYSCPGALGSCPLGSLQAVLGSRNYRVSFYMIGFFLVVGSLLGRFVCGWLCPFGLVQELLYKIPFFKKVKKLPGDKILVSIKYILLAVFVIILPLTMLDIIGQGVPAFCKYICPSGTLMGGIPLYIANGGIRRAAGWLFNYKMVLLIGMILLSMYAYRPFCRYLCPLGAIYGLFNPIALARYRIDEDKCTKCGKCKNVCKMDLPVYKKPNNTLCIRCGECKKACPSNAICNNHSIKMRVKSPRL